MGLLPLGIVVLDAKLTIGCKKNSEKDSAVSILQAYSYRIRNCNRLLLNTARYLSTIANNLLDFFVPLVIFGLLTGSPDPGAVTFPPEVRSQRRSSNGPFRFPHHLFSDHDHGRQRSDRGPQHLSCPYVGLTVH